MKSLVLLLSFTVPLKKICFLLIRIAYVFVCLVVRAGGIHLRQSVNSLVFVADFYRTLI